MDAWVWVVLETWSRKEGGGEGVGMGLENLFLSLSLIPLSSPSRARIKCQKMSKN